MTIDHKNKRPITDSERAAFRRLIEIQGEGAILRAIGLSRMGAYRALAGLPVTAGTRALLREALRTTNSIMDAFQHHGGIWIDA